MNDSKISVRYAKAFYALVKEKNLVEQAINDIQLINQCYNNVEDFAGVIESPIIKISDKKNIIKNIFKQSVNTLTFSFLNLVIENKRESYLAHIIRNFTNLYREDNNIVSADLTITYEWTEAEKDILLKNISKDLNKSVDLNVNNNKDIIGGFVLKIGDRQYDASIASYLKTIKKELLEKN